MSNLISILNSGESLEKTIVLTKLALEHNPKFYSNYEKIIVLYSENLPKKDKELNPHGTLGGLIENIRDKNYLKYKTLNDLWEDRNYILNKIRASGRISTRLEEKLSKDKRRFDKIIAKIPWYLIFEEFRKFLTTDFINHDFVKVEFLDIKKKAEEIFIKTPLTYNGLIKTYLLNPDGLISSKILSREYKFPKSDDLTEKERKQLNVLDKSIVLSPNVFMFLLGSYYSYNKNKNRHLIGFRNFKKIKRISYDKGIKFLQENKDLNCVEEPRNRLFNNLFYKINEDHSNLSIERKINLTIYGYLNKIL